MSKQTPLNLDKPMQTDEETPRKARCVCADVKHGTGDPNYYLFLVETDDGREVPYWICQNGTEKTAMFSIINTPERIEREDAEIWLNVYKDEDGIFVCGHPTREDADEDQIRIGNKRIACIKRTIPINCEHGEGLDTETLSTTGKPEGME